MRKSSFVEVLPTVSELNEMVRNNDPAAMRWFGAILERTNYLPLRRTDEENYVDALEKSAMPKFELTGRYTFRGDKAFLWAPVVEKLGKHWTPMFQETGSCVCQGGHNAVAYTSAVEVWETGEPEEVIYPNFSYIAYGRSRFYMGAKGPGEGSFGSVMARAVKEDGILPHTFQGLPPWTEKNGGLTIGRQQELKFSFIPDRQDEFDPFQEAAKKYPIQTVAQAKRADDVAQAIQNGYGCTCASMWGGQMRITPQGNPPVLLNKRTGEWAHQMSVIGWMLHPQLGELFYIQNSWGNPHGNDPAGGPPGGFWITKADMEWICRDEVFVFSSFVGFPARNLPFDTILPLRTGRKGK